MLANELALDGEDRDSVRRRWRQNKSAAWIALESETHHFAHTANTGIDRIMEAEAHFSHQWRVR